MRVYADAAYGSGAFLAELESRGVEPTVKVQPPQAPDGRFTKDRFTINAQAGTVTCPAGITVPIGRGRNSEGAANFGEACATCPLRSECTSSPRGRVITVGPHEAELRRGRARQRDPAFTADYRATRPKVERKIGHLMRRRHGGPQGACEVSPLRPCPSSVSGVDATGDV